MTIGQKQPGFLKKMDHSVTTKKNWRNFGSEFGGPLHYLKHFSGNMMANGAVLPEMLGNRSYVPRTNAMLPYIPDTFDYLAGRDDFHRNRRTSNNAFFAFDLRQHRPTIHYQSPPQNNQFCNRWSTKLPNGFNQVSASSNNAHSFSRQRKNSANAYKDNARFEITNEHGVLPAHSLKANNSKNFHPLEDDCFKKINELIFSIPRLTPAILCDLISNVSYSRLQIEMLSNSLQQLKIDSPTSDSTANSSQLVSDCPAVCTDAMKPLNQNDIAIRRIALLNFYSPLMDKCHLKKIVGDSSLNENSSDWKKRSVNCMHDTLEATEDDVSNNSYDEGTSAGEKFFCKHFMESRCEDEDAMSFLSCVLPPDFLDDDSDSSSVLPEVPKFAAPQAKPSNLFIILDTDTNCNVPEATDRWPEFSYASQKIRPKLTPPALPMFDFNLPSPRQNHKRYMQNQLNFDHFQSFSKSHYARRNKKIVNKKIQR